MSTDAAACLTGCHGDGRYPIIQHSFETVLKDERERETKTEAESLPHWPAAVCAEGPAPSVYTADTQTTIIDLSAVHSTNSCAHVCVTDANTHQAGLITQQI